MRCPFCGYEESKVVNSRPTDDGERIRRRRECLPVPEAVYDLRGYGNASYYCRKEGRFTPVV